MIKATRVWMLASSTCLCSATLFSGCDGCDERIEPTPEPTVQEIAESPTPITVSGEYRSTAFAIASEEEGCDYDGDGLGDNNLPVVFTTVYGELYNAIYEACALISGDPQTCVDTAWSWLEDHGLIVDESTFNALIAEGIADGSLTYLEHVYGTPDEATLDWFSGYLSAENLYVTDHSLGSQMGSIDRAGGTSTFGPGTFAYDLGGGLSLQIVETYATFLYTPGADEMSEGGLENGRLCGVVTQSEMEDFLVELIEAIPVPIQQYEDQIVDAVITLIESLSLFDLTINGEPAFSCGFTFTATYTDIANIE